MKIEEEQIIFSEFLVNQNKFPNIYLSKISFQFVQIFSNDPFDFILQIEYFLKFFLNFY